MRSLTLAYALAGADCIDVAADPAVVGAVQDALRVVANLISDARSRGYKIAGLPWLMVSLNDGEDPHFRKAEFNPALCPENCSRPCEQVCPVQAIVFHRAADDSAGDFSGVVDSACYGCGRCLSICPIQQISARSYVSTPAAIAPLVLAGVDAVEIHTQVGRLADFSRLWQAILPYLDQLKLVAISCPDGAGLIDYLWSLYEQIAPLPCALIWQTDGRPMSGDIGDGATRAAVKLGQKVLAAGLPGYVQLAGGTNNHTAFKLKALGLTKASKQPAYIAGVAYGSYARSILSPILEALEQPFTNAISQTISSTLIPGSTMTLPPGLTASVRLEESPDLLWQAVERAYGLVTQLKTSADADLIESYSDDLYRLKTF